MGFLDPQRRGYRNTRGRSLLRPPQAVVCGRNPRDGQHRPLSVLGSHLTRRYAPVDCRRTKSRAVARVVEEIMRSPRAHLACVNVPRSPMTDISYCGLASHRPSPSRGRISTLLMWARRQGDSRHVPGRTRLNPHLTGGGVWTAEVAPIFEGLSRRFGKR